MIRKKRVYRIEQNVLYNKHQTRHLKSIQRRLGGLKPMALIFGAKCIDGVVLVSDRLVTGGTQIAPTYTSKIRQSGNIPWAIFGAAGTGTLFEEFLTILPRNIDYQLRWNDYQNAKILHEAEQTLGKRKLNVQTLPWHEYSFEDFKHNCVNLQK
jgi:20S proteasome alpha/beta subunit